MYPGPQVLEKKSDFWVEKNNKTSFLSNFSYSFYLNINKWMQLKKILIKENENKKIGRNFLSIPL